MKLRLSLKKQWFDLTRSGEKKEDYREITDYWMKRLVVFRYELEPSSWIEMVESINIGVDTYRYFFEKYRGSFKPFNSNAMTLGYPRKNDASRVIEFEHDGIEIRTGKPEWGAEEGKLYFVIKHGARIA